MKFKKVLLSALSYVLIGAVAIGGTLAYLSDSDSDVNVMTTGKVEIAQHEYERVVNANGEYNTIVVDGVTSYELKEFTQGKPLYPFVGSVSDGYDSTEVRLAQLGHNSRGGMGVFPAKNVQDKFVVVENTGKSDAYVRTIVAFEAGAVVEEDWYKLISYSSHFTWKETQDWFVTEINGNNYYIVEFVYNGYEDIQHPNGVLTPGDYTYNSLAQVYMFNTATNEDVEALDGNDNGMFDILVFSQAVQTEGFTDAQSALDEAFGDITATNHPWVNGADIPATVSTADELIDAISDGGEVILVDDVQLTNKPLNISDNVVLNTNGHTISGVATNASTSQMINVKSGATLTLTGNGVISFGATTPDTNWGGVGQPAFPGYANNTIRCEGKLIIDGVTVKNVTAPGGASYAIDCYQGSDLIVNSGVIDGVDKCAIRMFCNSNTLSTNVTINGGTITGKRAIWVQLPGSNIANVRPVNLTITGGELICTNTEKDVCVYSYSYGDSFANTNINISGGVFTGDVCFGGGSAKSTEENVTITGGTFNGKLGRYLANDGWEDIAKP